MVTLVARELLKDFSKTELMEFEPHNTDPDCYMPTLFLAETNVVRETEWSGTKLWRAPSDHYRPRLSQQELMFVGEVFITPPGASGGVGQGDCFMRQCAPLEKAGRM